MVNPFIGTHAKSISYLEFWIDAKP
jgi:hypothetical protein